MRVCLAAGADHATVQGTPQAQSSLFLLGSTVGSPEITGAIITNILNTNNNLGGALFSVHAGLQYLDTKPLVSYSESYDSRNQIEKLPTWTTA